MNYELIRWNSALEKGASRFAVCWRDSNGIRSIRCEKTFDEAHAWASRNGYAAVIVDRWLNVGIDGVVWRTGDFDAATPSPQQTVRTA